MGLGFRCTGSDVLLGVDSSSIALDRGGPCSKVCPSARMRNQIRAGRRIVPNIRKGKQGIQTFMVLMGQSLAFKAKEGYLSRNGSYHKALCKLL
jgi:hypothetical protein